MKPGLVREPAGVLVVTVWSEDGELSRLVSMTDPFTASSTRRSPLRRHPAASDDAVVAVIRDWLKVLGTAATRPVPRIVRDALDGGDAPVTPP